MATGLASPQAASPSRPAHVRVGLTGAAAVTVLALAVRLATATTQSFWLDEAYTEHLVHLGLGTMLSEIPRTESTPPLYYLLAWGWTHVFGYGELALRAVSALAGAATVTCAYLLAGRLAGARAGLIAGVLLSLSPIMVWYSQEARAYALATLLATASLLCLIRYRDSGRVTWAAAWAATASLGLCGHYFVGFVVLPEVVWLLWRRRERPEVRVGIGVLALVVLALLPLALAQHGTGHADYIAQDSLATRALKLPKQYLIGYVSPVQILTTAGAAVLVLVGSLWPLLRGRAWVPTPARIVLAAGLSGVGGPLLLALVGFDFVDTRNLLAALVPLLVIAAVGFASPEARPWGLWLAGALAALFAVVVVVVNADPRYQRSDWGGASSALGPARVTRVIVVSPGDSLLPLQAYQPRVRLLGAPVEVREIDIVGVALPIGGSGLGPVPRPPAQPQVPAGFFPAGTVHTRAYTLLRYRSAAPATVSAPELTPLYPGVTGALLVQGAGRQRSGP
ncbi:MAG: glycosyltransferase family 39 protein [Solirubrobacteraceae bacterium]